MPTFIQMDRDSAINMLRTIRDILWPPEDPGADWDANTIEAVAHVLEGHEPPEPHRPGAIRPGGPYEDYQV